ncbi:MAG: DNA polymerase III subunit delta, partial [Eubacteriales bacterium]
SGEIEKIASYVKGDKIKTSDVVKIASQSLEYNVFKAHDLLMKKETAEALRLLNDVLETEKSPFGVMGLIAAKFRAMYKARALIDAKYPQDKAIKLIGGHPYVAKMALQDARSFSAEALMDGINTLAKLDYLYKTGQMDVNLSFAKTLMEIYGA